LAGSSVSVAAAVAPATRMRPPFLGVCAWADIAAPAMPPASVACMPPAISIARMSRRVAPRLSDSIMRRLSPGPTSFSKLLLLLSLMVGTPLVGSMGKG
jgi:hypothetical protein